MTTARAGAVQEPRVFEAVDKYGNPSRIKMTDGYPSKHKCGDPTHQDSWNQICQYIHDYSPSELRAIADAIDDSTGAGLGEGKEE